MIKAHDPRLHYINVAVEGFLLPEGAPIPEGTLLTQPITDGTSTSQPIPEGVPNVTSPLQYTLSEATSSHPSSQKGDEEEARPREAVDVSDSEDLYKVFNQLPSPVTEEEITSSDLMGIQQKRKSNLLELLESPPGGKPYRKSIPPPLPSPPSQPRIPTPPPVQQTRVEPVDHKERGMTRVRRPWRLGKAIPIKEMILRGDLSILGTCKRGLQGKLTREVSSRLPPGLGSTHGTEQSPTDQ